MKFHNPNCLSTASMAEHNKQEYACKRSELIASGYEPCGQCNP